jgi:hypothetical protein
MLLSCNDVTSMGNQYARSMIKQIVLLLYRGYRWHKPADGSLPAARVCSQSDRHVTVADVDTQRTVWLLWRACYLRYLHRSCLHRSCLHRSCRELVFWDVTLCSRWFNTPRRFEACMTLNMNAIVSLETRPPATPSAWILPLTLYNTVVNICTTCLSS